jgi:hypothetical protein
MRLVGCLRHEVDGGISSFDRGNAKR